MWLMAKTEESVKRSKYQIQRIFQIKEIFSNIMDDFQNVWQSNSNLPLLRRVRELANLIHDFIMRCPLTRLNYTIQNLLEFLNSSIVNVMMVHDK